jgi:hypothetical protein
VIKGRIGTNVIGTDVFVVRGKIGTTQHRFSAPNPKTNPSKKPYFKQLGRTNIYENSDKPQTEGLTLEHI